MKAKLYLIIIIVFLSIKGFGQTNVYQPYPSDTAYWEYYSVVYSGSSYSTSYYDELWYGDTVINGYTYTKRGGSLDYNGGYRQDIPNEKLYYIDKFNVETDVSVSQHLVVGDRFHDPVENSSIFDSLTITSIDSTLIGDKYHKTYHLGVGDAGIYVVGVGMVYRGGLEHMTELKCFFVDFIRLYGNNLDCNAKIAEATKDNISMIISPNPVFNELMVETNINTEQKLDVLNLIGQTVYTNIINKKATINTSAFANGVYILKLSSNKETKIIKFIKQ